MIAIFKRFLVVATVIGNCQQGYIHRERRAADQKQNPSVKSSGGPEQTK